MGIKKLSNKVWFILLRLAKLNINSTNSKFSEAQKRILFPYHIFYFFLFLALSLFFYLDFYLFHGFFFGKAANLNYTIYIKNTLAIQCADVVAATDKDIKVCSQHGIEATLFAHLIQLSFIVSIIDGAIYFFRHGSEHKYEDSVGFYFHGYLIPIITNFVIGSLLLAIFIFGGYIIEVFLPIKIGLNKLPLFFIIHSLVSAYLFQIITGAMAGQWKLILPYRLHPRSWWLDWSR